MWRRTALGLVAGLLAGAGALLYGGFSQKQLWASLHDLHPAPLGVAVVGALVMLGLQSLRWWIVMRPVLNLRYPDAYRAMMVGYFFNVLLPARGGDLLRVQYLGKRTGVSRAKLLGTEIVDFASDKWGWVAAFPIVCLLGSPPSWMYRALLLIGSAMVAVGALLVLMASGRWRNGPAWFMNLRSGFAANHWRRLLLVETLVAPLPWLWETFAILVAAHALDISLTPMQSFAVLTAFNVASAVPSPGNAGSFEAGGTLALTAMGVPHETALAFIFVYHLTQLVPSFAGGALVLVAEGEVLFGRNSVFRGAQQAEAEAAPALEPAPAVSPAGFD